MKDNKEFNGLVKLLNTTKTPKLIIDAYKIAERYDLMLSALEDFEIFISAYNVDLTEENLDTINEFRNLVCNLRTKAIRQKYLG